MTEIYGPSILGLAPDPDFMRLKDILPESGNTFISRRLNGPKIRLQSWNKKNNICHTYIIYFIRIKTNIQYSLISKEKKVLK